MMKNNDELRDELDGSTFLKNMKAQQGKGFKVPKHYFRHLPDEVWNQVKPVQPTVQARPNWLEKMELFLHGLVQPRFTLALASVTLLVVAAVIFLRDKNPVTTQQSSAEARLEDISDEELFAYVSNNIGDFDHRLVIEASESEISDAVKPQMPRFKAVIAKPDVEEMEQYIEEVIDEVDLEDLEELL